MASVQMEAGKHTTKQATSGHIPHDYRERENYANEDIDKSRTHLNQTFGCQTGKEAREKLLKRIAECDAVHPPKRVKADRKTSLEIHIPAPREGVDDEQLREFFSLVYTECENMFGKQNVIYGVSHFDEVHEYTDPQDKQVHASREGEHVVVIPMTDDMDFVPEKYKSGLNMNNFYRRNLPTLINKRLDACCQKVFGFDYQDGTGKKGKESVEALKEASAEYSALSAKIEDTRQAFFDEVQEQGEMINNEINLLNSREKELVEAVSSITGNHYDYDSEDFDFDAMMQDFGAWSKGVKSREKALDKRERASEEREAFLDEREASVDELLSKYQLDLQVLEARENAVTAKEEALERQKEVELKQERRRLRETYKNEINSEIQRLQEENQKELDRLKQDLQEKNDQKIAELGIEFMAWRREKRVRELDDDIGYIIRQQGYDKDVNGLIRR